MNQKLTVTVAVLAGFVGGILSQYVSPALVHAQAPGVPTKVTTQFLDLVNKNGDHVGNLAASDNGRIIFGIRDNNRPTEMVFRMYDLESKLKSAETSKR